jgi:hypothetical protein
MQHASNAPGRLFAGAHGGELRAVMRRDRIADVHAACVAKRLHPDSTFAELPPYRQTIVTRSAHSFPAPE